MAQTRRRKRRQRRKQTSRQCGGDLDEQAKQVVAQQLVQKEENRAKWLQVACRNPDNCLALGVYGDAIKAYFENFQSFANVDKSKVKPVGEPSNNGFVLELPYVKNGYTAYTILKSSRDAGSDNLYYEYLVGKLFINRYVRKVPVFLETYNLYSYKDEASHQDMIDAVRQNRPLDHFASYLHHLETDVTALQNINEFVPHIVDSCVKSNRVCLTIQHFDNVASIADQFSTHEKYNNFKGDIYGVLFQVYFALELLKDSYTHYDLHAGNVLLYKPFEGKKCILMRYHLKKANRYHPNGQDKVIEFRTEYIPKIIDYGRNYFNNGTFSSRDIIQQVCSAKECAPKCGDGVGYSVIQGSADGFDVSKFYWIDPTQRNASHDLRLLNWISNKVTGILGAHQDVKRMYRLTYNSNSGTPELQTAKDVHLLRNVSDVFEWVCRIMPRAGAFDKGFEKDKYGNGWETVATMDVYDDGRDYDFQVLPSASVSPAASSASAVAPSVPP